MSGRRLVADTFLPPERISELILFIRAHRVMLETDLARLYGVEVKHLKRQVRRNGERFPADFMFALSRSEYDSLRCQFGTLKRGRHTKYLPYAFTEQGVAMLSSVLNSPRAIQVNIAIMRAFVKLREVLASNRGLAKRLDSIERHLSAHGARLDGQADQIGAVFRAIRRLMTPRQKPRRPIGFIP